MSGFAIQQLPVAADSAIGADELAEYLHQLLPPTQLRQHTCTELPDGAELTCTDLLDRAELTFTTDT